MIKAMLVFDGYCGFCTKSVEWIKKLDKHNLIETVPWQTPGLLEEISLSAIEAKSAAWLFIEKKRYRGAAAINVALSIALKNRLFFCFYKLPIIKNIQDICYQLIANNRFRLPGVKAYCKRPENHCNKVDYASCKLPLR